MIELTLNYIYCKIRELSDKDLFVRGLIYRDQSKFIKLVLGDYWLVK